MNVHARTSLIRIHDEIFSNHFILRYFLFVTSFCSHWKKNENQESLRESKSRPVFSSIVDENMADSSDMRAISAQKRAIQQDQSAHNRIQHYKVD